MKQTFEVEIQTDYPKYNKVTIITENYELLEKLSNAVAEILEQYEQSIRF